MKINKTNKEIECLGSEQRHFSVLGILLSPTSASGLPSRHQVETKVH